MASSNSASWLLSSCSSRAKVCAEKLFPATVPGDRGQQVRAHPLGEQLRRDATGVVVAGQEPRHPGRLDPRGDGRRRIVLHERQRDLPVHRGEQPDRRRVVGLQDHPQLVLHRLLGLQQPVPVAGQRLDLGQQRRRHRQRPPVGVLVAQRVGEHERVEPVVLDRGDLVALPGARRDPRRHREHDMTVRLQLLDQQPLGALDRDRQPVAEPAQLAHADRPGRRRRG